MTSSTAPSDGGAAGADAPAPAHRVVIIGSGFGGLFAARALKRSKLDVTVVDRTNHHLFQPLLYQVATGILSEGEIAPATRDVLRRYANVHVEVGKVIDVDLTNRVVVSNQGLRTRRIPYDSLIVATGVETSYFGHDEWARWAPGMKSIDDALELRGRIFGAFEIAETSDSEATRQQWLTFLVIGGGPTGIEMAGQIAELAKRSLRRNFRVIDPRQTRVILLEGSDRVLSFFGRRLSKIAAASLTRQGVEVRTNTRVEGIDPTGIDVRLPDGSTERIEGRTKVWAAGTRTGSLARQLAERTGTEMDPMGRLKVLPDCTLPGHPEVFVVGDLMALDDLPGMAEVAMQSGRHAAEQIKRRAAGDPDPSRPLRYRDLGSMATVRRFSAVAMIGPLRIGGFVGWLFWLVVHLTFLTGFKNRVSALAHWAVSFVGRGRSERAITSLQVVSRVALADAIRGTGPGTAHPAPHEELTVFDYVAGANETAAQRADDQAGADPARRPATGDR